MRADRVIYLESVDSTNRYLMEGDFPPYTVASARFQERGRGRGGRLWQSAPGENLMFSVVLKPMSPEQLLGSQIAAGFAVVDALLPYADVRLKWPNDVVYHGKKLCGLLIETCFSGSKLIKAVLGIGINVKSHPEELSGRATSLTEAGGDIPEAGSLLTPLLDTLFETLGRFTAGELDIVSEWPCYSAYYMKKVPFHRNGRIEAVTEVGITPQGQLIALSEGGEREIITEGEVGYDFCI